MAHWAEYHFSRFSGPLGLSAGCNVKGCTYRAYRRKARGARVGRGWGLANTNSLRGEMIRHVKEAHPELKPDDSPKEDM